MKYAAVRTCNQSNEFVSPWCDSAREAEIWCNQNGVDFDAIHQVINWHECRNDTANI